MIDKWHSLRLFIQRLTAIFQRQRISLMEDMEFSGMIKRLGYWDKLVKGELKCGRCGKELSEHNISAIVVRRDSYIFICDAIECAGKIDRHD